MGELWESTAKSAVEIESACGNLRGDLNDPMACGCSLWKLLNSYGGCVGALGHRIKSH